jgi:peptidoglycan/xylan/chitin deacetylase (PgdA/CDA1 family)
MATQRDVRPTGTPVTGGARTMVDAVLRRTPAQPVFHRRAARSLAVLAYHDIRDQDRFAAQLDYLRRAASPVGLAEVVRAAEDGGGLPRRAVLVTFDDGHRDVLDVAMPMLRERGIPAVAFAVAGLIGTDSPHWWTEVKELVRAGGSAPAVAERTPDDSVRALKKIPNDARLAAIDELRRTASRPAPRVTQLTGPELVRLESGGIAIGSHSLTHPCLSRCEPETIRTEVDRSHAILAGALGHEIESFAYPDGDRDARVADAVQKAGHRVAFLFDHRLSPARPLDRFHISRLRVDGDATFDRFRIILSGLHPTIHRLRGLR